MKNDQMKVGDKVQIIWNERFYGTIEEGVVVRIEGQIKIKFDDQYVTEAQLRCNSNIEQISIRSNSKSI